MSKKPRLKKYAVEFVNNILHDTTELVIEAYNKSEAIDTATLYIDAFKTHYADEYAEDYKFKKVVPL